MVFPCLLTTRSILHTQKHAVSCQTPQFHIYTAIWTYPALGISLPPLGTSSLCWFSVYICIGLLLYLSDFKLWPLQCLHIAKRFIFLQHTGPFSSLSWVATELIINCLPWPSRLTSFWTNLYFIFPHLYLYCFLYLEYSKPLLRLKILTIFKHLIEMVSTSENNAQLTPGSFLST